jgi:hypothetical protein
MTVNPIATPTLSLGTANPICFGTSETFTAGAGAGPAITNYNFEVSGITEQSGASTTYTNSALTNGQVVTVIGTTASGCTGSANVTMTVNALPTPTLTASSNPICSGSSVTFTGGIGGGPAISNYNFEINGVSQQSGASNTYTTAAITSGEIVTVIATTASGCTATSTGVSMTVTPNNTIKLNTCSIDEMIFMNWLKTNLPFIVITLNPWETGNEESTISGEIVTFISVKAEKGKCLFTLPLKKSMEQKGNCGFITGQLNNLYHNND